MSGGRDSFLGCFIHWLHRQENWIVFLRSLKRSQASAREHSYPALTECGSPGYDPGAVFKFSKYLQYFFPNDYQCHRIRGRFELRYQRRWESEGETRETREASSTIKSSVLNIETGFTNHTRDLASNTVQSWLHETGETKTGEPKPNTHKRRVPTNELVVCGCCVGYDKGITKQSQMVLWGFMFFTLHYSTLHYIYLMKWNIL
jgi:hypothetical protein